MANTKSARKRAAKSALQRDKNRAARSKMRTLVKKARAAVAAGEADSGAVAVAVSGLDAAAQRTKSLPVGHGLTPYRGSDSLRSGPRDDHRPRPLHGSGHGRESYLAALLAAALARRDFVRAAVLR